MSLFNAGNALELLFLESPDPILMVDDQWKVCELNQQFCRVFNHSRAFFIGKKLDLVAGQLFEGRMLVRVQSAIRQMRSAEPVNRSYELTYRDYHLKLSSFVDKKTSSTYFLFRDVTDYHHALQELKESEYRYKMLSDLTFEGIVIHHDLKLLDCNVSFLNLMGYSREEVLGMNLLELIPAQVDKQLAIENVAKRSREPYDVVFMKKDGTRFVAEIAAKNVVFQGEETRIAAIRDISVRKQEEAARQQYQQRLERLVYLRTQELEESNREMEAFTYSVSHDLRAPLRTITGFAEYLEQDYHSLLDDEGRRYIRVISDSAARMDDLIVNLLRFSRASRVEPELIELNMAALARSMYMEVATPDEQQQFEFVVGYLPDVWGDLTLIKQVWSNLISNALKYSGKSVRKRIEIGCSEQSHFHISYYVKDYGAGFNMEYSHKLFEVFQRLHKEDEFKGTGVGLAIVKRIVEKHNGKVWAESELGRGSVFYFQLPVIQYKHEFNV